MDKELVESFRRSDAWLLDWRTEIEGVTRYAGKPVHPADAVAIDPGDVAGRLGPALTVMARAARLMHEGATGWREDIGDDLQASQLAHKAWGARDVLALGLGIHLQLSREQARWLADALVGDDSLRRWVDTHRTHTDES
jgi:hypothetical protein